MQFTPQQAAINAQLCEFFRSNERCCILKGYAGTGKTFLIGELARGLAAQNREVMLLAPTGRAARVLSRKTGHPASTIHRAIYNLKELVEHDDASAAFKFYFRVKDVATDNLDVVVFVDEASMVSDQYSEGEFLRFGSGRLLADLLDFLRIHDPRQKTNLVMVGDPAQLPPVNSPISPALDANYLSTVHNVKVREFELTEVVRQAADSPILREATEIRKTIASGFHNRLSIKPCPPQIEAIDSPDLPLRFIDENSNARLPKTVCVAYSNATCLNLNVSIRSKRFGGNGTEAPVAGDVLLVLRNSASTGLLNGDLISVKWADANAETFRIKVGTEFVELFFRNVRVVAEADDGSEVELGTKIVENVMFSEKRDLSPLEQKALYVHFKMRYPKLRPNTKEFTEALRSDPYFNALQVKFGYAITCHKAQGGEWDDVFVFFEHARTDALALRWAYTALTRARTRIFGINLPDRLPWSGAVATESVTKASTHSLTGTQTESPLSVAKATRWDGLFPEEPSFLRLQNRRMVAALTNAGIQVENVEVRPGNYYWRYDVCRNEGRAALRVSFKKNGKLTPELLGAAGTDKELGMQALPLLALDAIPVQPQKQEIDFPVEKPYLRAFHDDYMAPKVQAAAASIASVDHHEFHEKYHIVKGVTHVSIDAYYKARGTITRILKGGGDEELYRQVIEDT
jgi:hypothetical protein